MVGRKGVGNLLRSVKISLVLITPATFVRWNFYVSGIDVDD